MKLLTKKGDWELWGIGLSGRGMSRVVKKIESVLKVSGPPFWVATVNPEFVMAAQKDKYFAGIIKDKTSLNVVDGIGLIWAKTVGSHSHATIPKLFKGLQCGWEILCGRHQRKPVHGVELIDRLCRLAEKKGKSVFFLGGWGNRSQRTAVYFQNKYPRLKVAGYYGGNKVGEDEEILARLGKVNIDILLVAYAMKTQEEWIDRNLAKLKVRVVMGVGRSFDYYSGDLKRAPKWVRRMHLEWLYSLYREPKRWRRQLALPKFIGKVIFGGRQTEI